MAQGPPVNANTGSRRDIVDLARGIAIVQMIAYHLCYDLNYFSWIHAALIVDPGWIAWRSAIVSQFLFLAGMSLALRASGAAQAAAAPARFWRRWAQIAACACLVSISSWWLFGPRLIWFGVLHFVAAAQLLLRPAATWRRANLLLGMAALAAGLLVQSPLFTSDRLSWIGFSPSKPQTEDFVPLFPWLGVTLLGMAAANFWQSGEGRLSQALRSYQSRFLLPLALIGRWPLTVYMLHQPLMFGALLLVRKLIGALAN